MGIGCEWLNIAVFWGVMPFCPVQVETFRRKILAPSSRQIEQFCSSEILVKFLSHCTVLLIRRQGHLIYLLATLFTYLPRKMEQTECSETSAYKIQTPGNYPEENLQGRDAVGLWEFSALWMVTLSLSRRTKYLGCYVSITLEWYILHSSNTWEGYERRIRQCVKLHVDLKIAYDWIRREVL